MTPAIQKGLILLLTALPSVGLAAGKYTWFDDVSTDAGTVQMRPSAFGADLYTSLADNPDVRGVAPENKVSIYGDYTPRAAVSEDMSARRFANFGVRWQHRVSSTDRLSLSAQQGDSSLPLSSTSSASGADALDTRATVSWTRDLSWSWKPSITGGVFLGDETARDETSRQAGRRYYGFTVGGEMRLLQSHTPYVSFRMERSLYDLPDGGTSGMFNGGANGSNFTSLRATDESSRLAAGWRWQVQRGWSMQAEASYGFNFDNSPNLLPQERDRSRLFFGTRFDFR